MRTEVAYLPAPELLGELYEILDSRICWVGPMNENDARQLILEETQKPLQLKGNKDLITDQEPQASDLAPRLTEEEISQLLTLTGGYPALLKAACSWWLAIPDKPVISQWETALLAQQPIKYRLAEIWAGLTQEEQLALADIQKWHSQAKNSQKALTRMAKGLEARHGEVLTRLVAKGLCDQIEEGWYIRGNLLASYIAAAEGRGTGRVWLDERTGEIYQGERMLEGLEPLERAVLSFLVEQPRTRHTHTGLIENTWPGDQIYKEGISPDSLYQVVRKLRKRIEPNPAKPCYIVTWRGTPEGGYQFFPEGRPG
jgi:hypothetical protein